MAKSKDTPKPPYIKKLDESKSGGATSYSVGGTEKSRQTVVNEIKDGKHPGYHTTKINGTTYAKSNPDGREGDNVDKK